MIRVATGTDRNEVFSTPVTNKELISWKYINLNMNI